MVFAQLLNRRALAGSIPLTMKEKPGDAAWILEGELELPRSRGKYKLRAEGIQTVIVADRGLETKPPPSAIKTTRLHSPDVEIRIGYQ